MRFLALAADFDGTLAHNGHVEPQTVTALEQFVSTGRKLILVTGRELPELLDIFPAVNLFERVVAENGALLYRPGTRDTKLLGEPPPQRFVDALRRRELKPLSVGSSIVATVHPNETVVLEIIRDLGLELQVIFNKGSVMVLPAGVNKASGLVAALDELGLSRHNVVAIGDAENDHALLSLAEYSVAVANAVPTLQEAADHVTDKGHGAGAIELIEEILRSDLAGWPPRATRRKIVLGHRDNGEEVSILPAATNILVAGTSGSGKSTLSTGILERLVEQAYQCCVIDPEGDYQEFGGAIVFGNAQRGPSASEILTALEKPSSQVVVNLIGLKLQDRPAFFMGLLPRLQELRAKTGRPHWMLVDETHHLLPTDWDPAPVIMTQELTSMIYVTVHPEWVAPSVLKDIDIVAALGETPEATLKEFCKAANVAAPEMEPIALEAGQALLLFPKSNEAPFRLNIVPSQSERRRHRRKYAEGELPADRSFYFRGRHEKLNLRAQNLIVFLQMAEGVDEETWLHHLRNGDYSEWMRRCIKDDTLAQQIEDIERDSSLSAADSRRRVREVIEEHYTLPANATAL